MICKILVYPRWVGVFPHGRCNGAIVVMCYPKIRVLFRTHGNPAQTFFGVHNNPRTIDHNPCAAFEANNHSAIRLLFHCNFSHIAIIRYVVSSDINANNHRSLPFVLLLPSGDYADYTKTRGYGYEIILYEVCYLCLIKYGYRNTPGTLFKQPI